MARLRLFHEQVAVDSTTDGNTIGDVHTATMWDAMMAHAASLVQTQKDEAEAKHDALIAHRDKLKSDMKEQIGSLDTKLDRKLAAIDAELQKKQCDTDQAGKGISESREMKRKAFVERDKMLAGEALALQEAFIKRQTAASASRQAARNDTNAARLTIFAASAKADQLCLTEIVAASDVMTGKRKTAEPDAAMGTAEVAAPTSQP